MRALNLDPDRYSPKARALLESAGLVIDDGPLSRAELADRIADYDILLLRFAHRIDADLLGRAKRLKVIATNATGLDHIDTDCADALGIRVVSLRGDYEFLRTVHATAELTWALILMLERSLHGAMAAVRAGEWDRDRFVGRELAGQSLGILGFGRVGERVAHYALAFGMRVNAFDPVPKTASSAVCWQRSAEHLMEASDIVTVHLPYSSATHHFVESRLIGRLPRGARLVNTSRGAVVDEQAVVDALRAGHLGGIGVDVLTGEQEAGFPASSPLWQQALSDDRIVVTPHIGGAALQAWEKTELRIAERVVAALGKLQR